MKTASPTSPDELLTTGEAARVIGSSRQHVVDLCDRGDLPCVSVGRHRRIRWRDLESLARGTAPLTRDQRRSLWLGIAVAGRLATDPEGVLSKAWSNLAKLREVHAGQGVDRDLASWEDLLRGPITGIMHVLTSPSRGASDMRQNSTFAGVLSTKERSDALAGFKRFESEGHA